MAKRITIDKPDQNPSFPKLEERILSTWKAERTFERSLAKTKRGKPFVFYDGPPFATGLPHYGSLLQGVIKDVVPRFRTMQGRYVERRFGWDCHGLPVEYEVEKLLGIRNRREILQLGVAKFNQQCRSIVLRYTREWRKITGRLGRWVDFDRDYKTMDPEFMESIWWAIKGLWEKGLLYEGRRSMHICPRCATPLSNFEVSQGYRDRQDPAVYVRLPLRDDPATALLVWTTTPWTLPGNVLVAVNKHLTYVEVEHRGERLIVAEPRLTAVFPDGDYVLCRTVRAEELLGRRYEPPFPKRSLTGTSYEVVAADAVTADEGTGLLHVAPAFGEEDMEIGKRENAAFIQHIDINGVMTDDAPRYRGLKALEANERIVADLKRSRRLLRRETVTHSYPHCWRCDTPLLNFAATSWFVAVTKLKEQLLAGNEAIDWTPDHVKHGRFGKWLEGSRDWSISRNRFWGNPLPIWRCEACAELTVIGSLDELEKRSGKRPRDLHKQYVDKITLPCRHCGATARRIEDVLDCWFESGSMPYAKEHYPFQRKREFSRLYPADFIAEGIDQTRGWFYTLHVLGTALFGKPAYRSVLTTGIIQAEDGQKMSKRLKNYPDPEQVFATYGADALRLYLMTEPIVRGDDLRFRERDVAEMMRTFVGTLYNVYSFFATYAAADGWRPGGAVRATHVLDRWVRSRLATTVRETTDALERNDLMAAGRGLSRFLDDLSNWYVRRSRRRFWKTEADADQRQAYAVLYEVLTTFLRLAAPFTPFVTDHLHRKLTGESVHLAAWPKSGRADGDLEARMAAARTVARLGHAARSRAGVRVRQPLRSLSVVDRTGTGLADDAATVATLADELNVKELRFVTKPDGFVRELVQPVPAAIGPLFGHESQAVIEELKRGAYERKGDTVRIRGRDLPPEAVRLTWAPTGDLAVEGSANVVVGLDTAVDQELTDEGRARELIRHFQELRKAAGLDVSDRIAASIVTDDPDLERAVDRHRELVAAEILARSLEADPVRGQTTKSVTIGRARLTIGLARTG